MHKIRRKLTNFILILKIISVLTQNSENGQNEKPNIILILADDMGRNDASFYGSNQIQTPNIDALAYNGIVLNRFYTLPSCTPSRAALLTGNYPIRSGLQGLPITAGENNFLPEEMPLLPEKLKELGYKTHLVGKWHLGYAKKKYTPVKRGFDTHFGYWNGYVGYFNYIAINPLNMSGFDLYDEFTPAWSHKGKYATELFTEKSIEVIKNHDKNQPLFLFVSHLAPHSGFFDALEVPNITETNQKYAHIKEEKRRIYAGMIDSLDESVGNIIEALEQNKMLQNSIVVFLSDNGGETEGWHINFGSNWPLRGQKYTMYEGGVRGLAIAYSKLFKQKRQLNKELFHISDLFPTFYTAAGGNISDLGNIDGIDQWKTLTENIPTVRQDLLLNIDEKENNSAIISEGGRYKLMNGTFRNGLHDGHTGESGRSDLEPPYNITRILESKVNIAIRSLNNTNVLNATVVLKNRQEMDNNYCSESENTSILCTGFCLFDLFNDPCENQDLAREKPEIVEILIKKLKRYWNELIPQQPAEIDLNSNPVYYNNTWYTWLEDKITVNDLETNIL